MNKKWILGLDSLRIVLALIVLLSHLDTYSIFHSNNTNELYRLIGFIFGNSFVGVCAVIAFFVVSGIVIHFPYVNGKTMQPFSFLIKRFLRISIPMIAVYILAKVVGMTISKLPFWSLYCELIYYFLYPSILYFIRKKEWILYIFFALSFVSSYVIVFVNGTAFNDLITHNKALNAEYWQFGILVTAILGLPNWLLGVILARKYSLIKEYNFISRSKIYLIRMAIFFLSMICSVLRYHFSLSYTLSLNIFGLFAAIWIWYEINYWSKHTTIKLFEQMGKISYSVYICHALVVYIIAHSFKPSLCIISLEIIATLLFSYLFYLIVEKPSHKLAQKIR